MQLFIAFLHVEDYLVILHHNIIACIYTVGGGLCGLMLYRSGFVNLSGYAELDVIFLIILLSLTRHFF